MPSPRPSRLSAWLRLVSMLERVILFEISLAVGLLNLGIALALAARLGVVPRKPVEAFLSRAEKRTDFLWRWLDSGQAPAKP